MKNEKIDLITPTLLLILGFKFPMIFWSLFALLVLFALVRGIIEK